ncbi:MAG: hypothetical protein PHD74_06695 [Candidatus Krumholzibacteria bacterium]|nr:hypothetical protein [Candidatus Krumholzibacteria bacterium]
MIWVIVGLVWVKSLSRWRQWATKGLAVAIAASAIANFGPGQFGSRLHGEVAQRFMVLYWATIGVAVEAVAVFWLTRTYRHGKSRSAAGPA